MNSRYCCSTLFGFCKRVTYDVDDVFVRRPKSGYSDMKSIDCFVAVKNDLYR